MNIIFKASAILAGAITVLSSLVYVTGFHQNFMTSQAVFLFGAITLNVAIISWALGKTAGTHSYGQQLGQAAGIGVVGGLLVVILSWLLLSSVFPDAIEEARASAVAYLDASDVDATQYDQQIATLEAATPMSQSIPGGMGTFFTSLVSGAIVAVFKRKK